MCRSSGLNSIASNSSGSTLVLHDVAQMQVAVALDHRALRAPVLQQGREPGEVPGAPGGERPELLVRRLRQTGAQVRISQRSGNYPAPSGWRPRGHRTPVVTQAVRRGNPR